MTAKNRKLTSLQDHAQPPLGPIELRGIETLKAGPRKLRRHSPKQIAKLASSIRTFGFVLPIPIDEAGTILDGHACVEAARSIGLKQVPTLTIMHLSPEKMRALSIALNRLAELGEWDKDVLRLEFADLLELDLDFEIEVTGFDTAEIDLMLDDGGEAAEASDGEEAVEPDAVAVTRLGDIWLLGPHKVLCNSCHDDAGWQRLLDGEQARMVFSDPPYNCPIQGHVSGLGKHQHREFAEAVGEMSDTEFAAWLGKALTAMAKPLIDGAILAVCMDWRNILALTLAGRDAGLSLINLCVWNKGSGGMGSLYRSQHELVCIFKKGTAPHINNVQLGRFGRYRTNVWDYAGANSFSRTRDQDLADHPTVKPTALVADAIRDVTRRGDLVLDGFLGSGSTIFAAERTGRRAYGCELDPLYVDLIIRRWEQASGGKATLEASGETFAEVAERREADEPEPVSAPKVPLIRQRSRPPLAA